MTDTNKTALEQTKEYGVVRKFSEKSNELKRKGGDLENKNEGDIDIVILLR